MRQILFFILMAIFCPFTFSQPYQIISFTENSRYSVNDGNKTELLMPTTDYSVVGNDIVITHHFFNASVRETSLDNREYEIVHINGYGYDAEKGKPQLPGYTDIIPIGSDDTDLQIFQSDYLEYKGFNIVPAQNENIVNDVTDSTFVMDKSVYSKNEFFPHKIASIQGVQVYKGQKYAFIRINPIQFNPVTGVIRCYQDVQYYIKNTSNNSFVKNTLDNNNPYVFTKQENFIIVTNDSLLPSIQNFVKWKEEQGYKVSILSKLVWDSDQEVRDSIRSIYWNNEQSYDSRYLLIIGDYSIVPARVMFNSAENYVTDHYYACVDDDDDELEDFARGRIPISIADSVQKVLSFIVEKEKGLYFWERGIHSAFFNVLNNKHNEDLNCVSFSEDIKEYMEGHQFLIDRVYKAANDTDPLRYSTTYANGDSVAYELRRPQFSWSGSYTDIIDALQSGCDYVMYHGHGNYFSLEQIDFTQNTIDDITENICSPVFFCLSCLSGQYVDVLNNGTVLNRPNRFGAKMSDKKISPTLVVSSGNCSSPYVEPFGEAMFSSLYLDSILSPQLGLPSFLYSQIFELNSRRRTEIGEMMRFGFTKMLQSFGLTTKAIQETTHMHVFGDPSYHFPVNAPHELDSIDIYRLNDSICVDLNGLSQCTIIFIEEDVSGRVQTYKRLEDMSDNYRFCDTTNYNKIIINKNNSVPYVLNQIRSVYLQDTNMFSKREYVGGNIKAGRNVTNNCSVGDVVVKNGGSLKLMHTDKTVLEKGFKVEVGGKLIIKRQ